MLSRHRARRGWRTVTHWSLDLFQRDLRTSLGGESDGLVLVAEALQNEIQYTRLCEILTDVHELVPLLARLGNLSISVLVWHHNHAVQFGHQNTPPLY